MGTQLCGPAERAIGTAAEAFAGDEPRFGARMAPAAADAQGLVGAMFTTPKDLRHLAEQHFDELFVPVEVLADSGHAAVLVLRTDGAGPLVVHAERERHWYPFRVTRVEPAPETARS
jgi:hypothetical protein